MTNIITQQQVDKFGGFLITKDVRRDSLPQVRQRLKKMIFAILAMIVTLVFMRVMGLENYVIKNTPLRVMHLVGFVAVFSAISAVQMKRYIAFREAFEAQNGARDIAAQ